MEYLRDYPFEPSKLQHDHVQMTLFGADLEPTRRLSWQSEYQPGAHEGISEALRLWRCDMGDLLDELTLTHSAVRTLAQLLASTLYNLGAREAANVLQHPTPMAITSAMDRSKRQISVCRRQASTLHDVHGAMSDYNSELCIELADKEDKIDTVIAAIEAVVHPGVEQDADLDPADIPLDPNPEATVAMQRAVGAFSRGEDGYESSSTEAGDEREARMQMHVTPDTLMANVGGSVEGMPAKQEVMLAEQTAVSSSSAGPCLGIVVGWMGLVSTAEPVARVLHEQHAAEAEEQYAAEVPMTSEEQYAAEVPMSSAEQYVAEGPHGDWRAVCGSQCF